jgi:hypothetical protein
VKRTALSRGKGLVRKAGLSRGEKPLERRTPLEGGRGTPRRDAVPTPPPAWLSVAIEMVEAGATYREVARHVGSSASTVNRWVIRAAPHLLVARHLSKVERTCEQCGEAFVLAGHLAAKPGWGRFCQRECYNAWQRSRKLARLAASPCEQCGGAKPEARAHQKACSPECANALKARAKQGERNPNWKPQTDEGRWRSGLAGACVKCGAKGGSGRWGRLHLHHVVYEQHVRANGGDPYDPDNSLTLCVRCHASHHKSSVNREHLPLAVLRDENFDYAARLYGTLAAFDYLRRRYAGEDERLKVLLEVAVRPTPSAASRTA